MTSSVSPGSGRRIAGIAEQAIQVEDVDCRFGSLEVLSRISLHVPGGGRLAVVGPSGCGKSTLLSLVAGLLQPAAGRIAVGDRADAAGRLQRCALMPQQDMLLPWRDALDNACIALQNRGMRRTEARRRATPLFERFGLSEFERAPIWELSGGMRQRIAFLRTLLAEKPVLLLDEPFAALDALTREEMQEWLAAALDAEPCTVLLVTHDVDEALRLGTRVAVMSRRPGRIVLEAASADTSRERVLEALRA
jgi:ABC-type nitrate/sulfonate/bicarbonate transport system ATPase subunit